MLAETPPQWSGDTLQRPSTVRQLPGGFAQILPGFQCCQTPVVSPVLSRRSSECWYLGQVNFSGGSSRRHEKATVVDPGYVGRSGPSPIAWRGEAGLSLLDGRRAPAPKERGAP